MELLTAIINAFKEFFKALKEFLMGIKMDKIESISKFGDKIGNLGDLLGK